MPALHTFSARDHRESKSLPKGLVVAISVLQLALVVLVWLLALLPVAVMALCAMAFQAVKSAVVKAPAAIES